MEHKKEFSLPAAIVNQRDVSRLIQELEATETFLQEAKIRKSNEAKLPEPSRLLSELCETSGVNLLHEVERNKLKETLSAIKNESPIMHISFPAEPPAAAISKLVDWFRKEIHPYTLITIGLQPGLGAGCVLRTRNKYFDFSLRQHLNKQHGLLVEKLTGGNPASS